MEKTIYLNPIESANRTAELLRKKGCDMVICLSHLGDKYEDDKLSDEILAKESYDIDLIIGGHTHRFFEEPRKYKNRRGGDTIVNQVGWAGIQLGRLDYSFSGGGKKNLANAHTVVIGKKNKGIKNFFFNIKSTYSHPPIYFFSTFPQMEKIR